MSETPLIVCIDDDPSVCESLGRFLKAFNFRAETFQSAEEFLQFERLNETSCLITDVRLGGISGLQLQDHLAHFGYRIPVIVMSAFPDAWIRTRVFNAGAISFLNKPITKTDLLNCIRLALEQTAGGEAHA